MRILQIHNRYREPGGEDTVVAAEAELLRSAGHDVRQFHVENPEGILKAGSALSLAAWNPFAARRVRDISRSFRPHVAHVHNTWYSLSPSVLTALKSAGVPVVMTVHNYRLTCANAQLFRGGEPCELCVDQHPWYGVRYRCYRSSRLASASAATTIALNRKLGTWCRSVDSFLVMTQWGRSRLVAAGLPPEKVRVKPHFVSDPGPRARPPGASNTVVYVGRLSPEKGLRILIKAWRATAPRDVQLSIAGDGPDRSEIEAIAPAGVQFLGRVSRADVSRLMLSARALVFPSLLYETFGMALAEAFAAGLPALASDRGAMRAMIQPLGSAWLVAPGDVGAWARALNMLTDIDAVNSAGALARRIYEAQFTPQRGLQLLEEAYFDVTK